MPVRRGYTTKNGKKIGYYVWGNQKKYYYEIGNDRSRSAAMKKAEKQARAIYSTGYTSGK